VAVRKITLRLPCHDANWIEHTESNTDALPTHFMI